MKKISYLASCLVAVLFAIMLFGQASQAVAAPIVSNGSDSISSLPVSGKFSAFNGTLQLSYPKDNILVDSKGLKADDQSVSFAVYLPEGGSPDAKVYTLVSNIYKISVNDTVYQLLNPGQLTLAYNPNVSNLVADQLAVWYSPDISSDEGYSWDEDNNVNLGGLMNTSKHTVTAPFQITGRKGYFAVFLAQRSFGEFDDSNNAAAWSYSSVMPLWAKGIVEPLPVLSELPPDFGLAKDINRLEFTTMLVKGLGLPLTNVPAVEDAQMFRDGFGSKKFYEADAEDIKAVYFGNSYSNTYTTFSPTHPIGYGYHIYDGKHMPIQYVETAARHGIVNGFLDRKFNPQDALTREQAAVILARVSNLKISDDAKQVSQGLQKLFSDSNIISPWAAPSLLAAANAKLIEGKANSDPKSKLREFDPKANLTRAEGIALTYRMLKKLKKI